MKTRISAVPPSLRGKKRTANKLRLAICIKFNWLKIQGFNGLLRHIQADILRLSAEVRASGQSVCGKILLLHSLQFKGQML